MTARLSYRRFALIFANLLLTLVAGCAVVESKLDSDDAGLVYYLPKTMLRVEILLENVPGKESKVALKSLDISTFQVPDPRHRYTLHYRRNPFFHDRLCYTLDPDNPSLLSTVEISTEDATPEIAIALAQLAAKLSGDPSDRAAEDAKTKAALFGLQPNEKHIVVVVDLSEPGAFQDANRQLAKRVRGLKLSIPGIEHIEGDARSACHERGLCFRTSVKVPITLQHNGEVVDVPGKTSTEFEIVNHRHIGSMDIERAVMVEKVTRLGFQKGVLTHVIVRKPSEVLGAVKLPIAVVDTLLSVPVNFANRLTAPNAQVAAQADAVTKLNAQLAAIVARQREGTLGDKDYQNVFKLTCTKQTNRGLLNVQ